MSLRSRAYIYAMNILFTLVFLICTFLLLCTSPDTFLYALLEGAGKGATVSASLIATYCVWLGLMRVWEDSGVARGISKLLKPLLKHLFKTEDEEALQAIAKTTMQNFDDFFEGKPLKAR